MSNLSSFEWLSLPANEAAQRLLGCELEMQQSGQAMRVKIIETESYDQDDPASHAYGGPSKRNQLMFESAGHLYVYFTYGMHYCCNIVCGPQGYGSGALIRAVEPLTGEDIMELRRSNDGRQVKGYNLTNGPAKLCQALGIDKRMNGHDLSRPPLKLIKKDPLPSDQVVTTTRVGISKNKDVPKRFYIKNNPYVSKK